MRIEETVAHQDEQRSDDIAIVGLAGRFPGAKNVDQFWQNLRDGVESVRFFTDEELLAEGVDPALLQDPHVVKAAAVLEDVGWFDAGFFGFTPREAEILDPQHRLFLEIASESLEHAGYNPDTYPGLINVFAGVGWSNYLMFHLLPNQAMLEAMGSLTIGLSNEKDFFATRVAYKLNLRGASMTVQTACSSSLVSVHLACQSLLNGECDMALAGGLAIALPQKQAYVYVEGGINSSDGHCRTFDEKADGTISGSGGGVVVLKRLDDALADGDTIHAVIRGSAINNDGSQKVGFSAPSVRGQASVIAEALAIAGVEADTIDYVETHGTATPLGDPIEFSALKQVYQASTDRKNGCGLGSVKTNIGHLDAGAGIAGLIKTVLALKHKQIPPSLHFAKPNPQLDIANSPFYVNTTLREWQQRGTPRRAGVSSFGMGGTNAHAVLEEAPEQEEALESSRPQHVLVLSAKTATALEAATDNLQAYLQEHPNVDLADVAYTLQVGRRAFAHRRVLVARDVQDAVQALATRDPKRLLSHENDRSKRPVAFLLPGLGDHYVHMAAELYRTEPTFQKHLDRCCDLLIPTLGFDLRSILYPDGGEIVSVPTAGFDLRKMLRRDSQSDLLADKLNQISIAHPVLFIIEYALSKLLIEWGLRPQAMIGHSLGEYVAATLAGVFSLESALALVTKRALLIQELEAGAMLAVPMAEADVQPLLGEGLYMATVNGPAHVVVSGTVEAVSRLEQQLRERGVTSIRVNATHAFHSPLMEPIAEPLKQMITNLKLKVPKIPFVSNVTGTWITEQEVTDPNYWARHLCQTVRFAEGIRELCQDDNLALVEVGPGQTLSSFVMLNKQENAADRIVLPTIRMHYETRSDAAFLLNTLGQLWLSGVEVQWEDYHADEPRRRIPLPTYPFERQFYWIDPPRSGAAANVSQQATVHALQQNALSGSKEATRSINDSLYTPVWKQSQLPNALQTTANAEQQRWLIFIDDCGLGDSLADLLQQQGHEVITVTAGASFAKTGAGSYTIHPRRRDDYLALVQELQEREQTPHLVLHLWNVAGEETVHEGAVESELTGQSEFATWQARGLYSLLYLTQAFGKHLLTDSLNVWVLSTQLHELGGWEVAVPEKATLLGACKVIPQEYPNITVRSLDLLLPPPGSSHMSHLHRQLLQEFQAQDAERVIAYRGRQRFVQQYEPLLPQHTQAQASPLRERGVYLIVGGLGMMGLLLAKHLAQHAHAKLVLTSRYGLPARDEWGRWLTESRADDIVCTRIQQVQELEALGADVLIVQADVQDEGQMQQALQRAREHFGTLHGVIYAAGYSDPDALTTIAETGPAECDLHFAARVHGLYVLADVLQARGDTLDFCLLVSSLAAVLGGLGFVAPGAAHLFMDAFAGLQNRNGHTRWITVNFDQLTPEEVGLSLQLVLTTRAIQLVVSKQDVTERLHRWMQMQNSGPATVQGVASGMLHPRPNLHNPYVAPTNELEAALADILQDLLGIEQVGIHDNFFQLGGNSLLGTQVITRIRVAFQIDLPLRVLFEANTVYDLALLVEDVMLSELEALDEEEAERML